MDFRTSQVGEVSNRDRQDAGGIRTHGECRFGSGCDQGGESLEPTIEPSYALGSFLAAWLER
jgi:hypothetical protein